MVGTLDDFTDADLDGIDDAVSAVADVVTDGDSIPDFQQLDSDDDSLSDLLEATGIDTGGDGRADVPVLVLPDSDGDGIPYFQDLHRCC